MLKIRWHGHACFEITDDQTIITDPHDGKSIGIPTPSVTGDIVLISHNHYDHNSVKTVEKENTKIINETRKRTLDSVSIKGYSSYHDENQGAKRGENIIFKFTVDAITFCHLGDLGHQLDDQLAKNLEGIDVLFIPIGGTYTLDATGAWDIINYIKPSVVIPMHYKIEGLSLPIAGVDPFLQQSKDCKILKVGNEIDIENEELPTKPEIWVFTL